MIPKYKRLVEALLDTIATLPPNAKLPSENEMVKRFNVSKGTVKKAVDELILYGKIRRVDKAGLFTVDRKLFKPFDVFTGFTGEVEAMGGKVKNVLIAFELIQADHHLATILDIDVDDFVYKLVRLRKKDDVPLVLDESYFPKALVPLSETVVSGSIYAYMQKVLKLKPEKAVQQIKAVFAPDTYLEHLEVDLSTPILSVEMTGYLQDGRIFEYTKSYKNTDKYELVIASS